MVLGSSGSLKVSTTLALGATFWFPGLGVMAVTVGGVVSTGETAKVKLYSALSALPLRSRAPVRTRAVTLPVGIGDDGVSVAVRAAAFQLTALAIPSSRKFVEVT